MFYPCSENKGADQLRSYCEADLRLCFRICRLLVFPWGSSFMKIIKDTEIWRGAQWHSGVASDSESRGPGFDPQWWHRCGLKQGTLTLHITLLVNTQEEAAPS